MKTSKEKAGELLEKYYNSEQLCDCQTKYIVRRSAIECAKIAVDEIIKLIKYHGKDIGNEYSLMDWQEVKNELNKM